MADCSSIQKSLAWCQGRPELPGMKRRIYYISKYNIVQWPQLIHDENGRLTSASYAGDFTLRADATWKYIDVIADKSQLTSEAQGEFPSQTQLNKLTAVHPGVEAEASAAAAYLNNNDNVFLVVDMRGKFRVVGSEKWPTKTSVAQDIGQGPTGSANTTISVEATDECPAPFYAGKITTEDGIINPNGNPTQYVPVNNGSSSTGGGNTTGGSTTGGGSTGGTPTYSDSVLINGMKRTVKKGDTLPFDGPIKSIKITGTNMNNVTLSYNHASANMPKEPFSITNNGTDATWTGSIPIGDKAVIYRGYSADGSTGESWFSINVTDPDDVITD